VKFTKICFLLALVMGFVAALSFPAQAYDIIDFDIPHSNPGASIAYGGLGGPVVGADIAIPELVLETVLGGVIQGPYPVNGGVLAFTSGNLSSTVDSLVWIFGPNSSPGSITIYGGVPALGIANGTLLLSGTVTDAVAVSGGQVDVNCTDTKNTLLLSKLGYPPQTSIGRVALEGAMSPTGVVPPAGFSLIGVYSSGMSNDVVVPLSPSILLLGTGLVGLLGLRRFKKG